MMLVDGIQADRDAVGDLQTDLHTNEQAFASQSEQLMSLQQRTATKVIAAWRNHQLYSALRTWKNRTAAERDVNAELRGKYLIRWKNRGLQKAFATWRVVLQGENKRKTKHYISQVVHDASGEETKIVNVAKERRRNHAV
jgi:hypothetical protein